MSIVIASVLPPFTLNLWQDVQDMLSYGFMQRALLAGTILSGVAGLIGFFVVMRHQTFAGESLSDVAFTGSMGGAAFGINPLISLIGTTIIVALAMGGFGERLRGRDVAIGTVLAWVLGLGVLFLSLFNTHVSGTGTGFSGVTVLFGNILGITDGPDNYHRAHQWPRHPSPRAHRTPIALCLAGPGCSSSTGCTCASTWAGLHGIAGSNREYCDDGSRCIASICATAFACRYRLPDDQPTI